MPEISTTQFIAAMYEALDAMHAAKCVTHEQKIMRMERLQKIINEEMAKEKEQDEHRSIQKRVS